MPDRNTFSGLRDYALILFSIDCGARPGEALLLKKEDFNFPGLLVNIPAPVAKTRQSRTIPIMVQTVSAVQKLLAHHHKRWEGAPVFCTWEGKPFSVGGWGHRLKIYSKKLGVKITPYYLRHAAALGMLRAGMSVFALRDMLGHTTLSMTQKYLSLTLEDVRREHPPASLVNAVIPPKDRLRIL